MWLHWDISLLTFFFLWGRGREGYRTVGRVPAMHLANTKIYPLHFI